MEDTSKWKQETIEFLFLDCGGMRDGDKLGLNLTGHNNDFFVDSGEILFN